MSVQEQIQQSRQQIESQRQQLELAKKSIPKVTTAQLLQRKGTQALQQMLMEKSKQKPLRQISEAQGQLGQAEVEFEKEVALKAPEYGQAQYTEPLIQQAKTEVQKRIDDLNARIKKREEYIVRKREDRSDKDRSKDIDRAEDDISVYRAELNEYQKGIGLSAVDLIKQHFSGYLKKKAQYEADYRQARNDQQNQFNEMKNKPEFKEDLAKLGLDKKAYVSLSDYEGAVKKFNQNVAYEQNLVNWATKAGFDKLPESIQQTMKDRGLVTFEQPEITKEIQLRSGQPVTIGSGVLGSTPSVKFDQEFYDTRTGMMTTPTFQGSGTSITRFPTPEEIAVIKKREELGPVASYVFGGAKTMSENILTANIRDLKDRSSEVGKAYQDIELLGTQLESLGTANINELGEWKGSESDLNSYNEMVDRYNRRYETIQQKGTIGVGLFGEMEQKPIQQFFPEYGEGRFAEARQFISDVYKPAEVALASLGATSKRGWEEVARGYGEIGGLIRDFQEPTTDVRKEPIWFGATEKIKEGWGYIGEGFKEIGSVYKQEIPGLFSDLSSYYTAKGQPKKAGWADVGGAISSTIGEGISLFGSGVQRVGQGTADTISFLGDVGTARTGQDWLKIAERSTGFLQTATRTTGKISEVTTPAIPMVALSVGSPGLFRTAFYGGQALRLGTAVEQEKGFTPGVQRYFIESPAESLLTVGALGFEAYRGVRYLGRQTLPERTLIKAPRRTLKTTEIIGRDYGKTVLFDKQKLGQYAFDGSRQTTSRVWRDIVRKGARRLGFDVSDDFLKVYKGSPFAQPKVYTKELNLLKKTYGVSDWRARSILRYQAPRVIEQELAGGIIQVGEKGGASLFKYVTRQPQIVVDKKLGLKTRGATPKVDTTFTVRKPIKSNLGSIQGFQERGFTISTQGKKFRELKIIDTKTFSRAGEQFEFLKPSRYIKGGFDKGTAYSIKGVSGSIDRLSIKPIRRQAISIIKEPPIRQVSASKTTLSIEKIPSGGKDFISSGGKKTILIKGERILKDVTTIESPKTIRTIATPKVKLTQKIDFVKPITRDTQLVSQRVKQESIYAGTGQYEVTESLSPVKDSRQIKIDLVKPSFKTGVILAQSLISLQKIKSAQIGKIKSMEMTALKSINLNKVDSISKQIKMSTQKIAQKQALRLRQPQITETMKVSSLSKVFSPKQPTPQRPPRPPRPTTPFKFGLPILDSRNERLRKKRQKDLDKAFTVELRRRGKFLQTGVALSKEEAIAFGASKTLGGAGATFRLKETKQPRRSLGLGLPGRFLDLFRPSKSKRETPLTFVQRREKRILTPGEKREISQLGGRPRKSERRSR